MLLLTNLFVWMIAGAAVLLGMSFLLSKIVPRMPNKASRFIVIFALGVPLGMLYGYSKVWVHASSDMSWTAALTVALPSAFLCAILRTFWGHDRGTQISSERCVYPWSAVGRMTV